MRLNSNNRYQISKNKSVIDLAVRYVKLKGFGEKELIAINYVRMKKRVHLPFKSVGSEGRSQTECYIDVNSKSQIQWGFLSEISGEISRSQKRIWTEFLRWMSMRNVRMEMDFKPDK